MLDGAGGCRSDQVWWYHFFDMSPYFTIQHDIINCLLSPCASWAHVQAA
jgi:hypothetical protein